MMNSMGVVATALRRPQTYVGCAREVLSARKKFESMARTYPELQPWLEGGAS